MSKKESYESNRLNQWYIRGFGIIIATLIISIMTFLFINLDDALFTNDLEFEKFNYIILVKKIGQMLWTFRAYDLILILILLLMIIISTYYFFNVKSFISPMDQKRGGQNR